MPFPQLRLKTKSLDSSLGDSRMPKLAVMEEKAALGKGSCNTCIAHPAVEASGAPQPT